MPEPTCTRIFSRFGPLIGEMNSSARPVAPEVWYLASSPTSAGALLGTVHVLIAYGPEGRLAVFCRPQPVGELMKATSFSAAASLAPVVDFGMYAPPASQTVACGVPESDGIAK